MGYIGMCRCEGYGFQAVYSRIGYINQYLGLEQGIIFRETDQLVEDFMQTRDCGIRFCFGQTVLVTSVVSGIQPLQDRGNSGVYSSIGQQNSAELVLVQVKGSRVPAAHPHPVIPKVPPREKWPDLNRAVIQIHEKVFRKK